MNIMRNPEMKKHMLLFLSVLLLISGGLFLFDKKMSLAAFFTGFVFIMLFYIVSFTRYRKMAELSYLLDKVLHGEDAFLISSEREGELSLLENEIQKMLIALREKNELLKKERAFLSDSMADISHQLRTPLTSINIILTLLQAETLPRERRFELVSDLSRLIKRIDDLVTNLLKLSKIDAGTVIFEKKRIRVSELIKQSFLPLEVAFDIREQRLVVKTEEESFIGDISWTAEAIGNILKNCSEHAGQGGAVTVTARETPMFTEIVIKDNGKGFFEEDIPFLFERFYRGKNSSEDSYGIGLSLSKAIITGQNGSIKAENSKEGGALFSIRFLK